MLCAICNKRPAKRFCPAKGEKICAICCGTEREVTIDCPSDCSYLISARRYENEHRKPITAEQVPYRDVQVPSEFVRERRDVVSGLGMTILKFAAENRALDDSGARDALSALAETYRTLSSGILYEKAPDGPRGTRSLLAIEPISAGFQKTGIGANGIFRAEGFAGISSADFSAAGGGAGNASAAALARVSGFPARAIPARCGTGERSFPHCDAVINTACGAPSNRFQEEWRAASDRTDTPELRRKNSLLLKHLERSLDSSPTKRARNDA